MDMLRVFCEEETAFLNVIFPNLKFKSIKLHLCLKTTSLNVKKERKKMKHTNVTSVLDRAEWLRVMFRLSYPPVK